ncbi:nitrile hydratase subunit beta [Sulfitobacter sp. SK012]|uniref:nitrile hydratase subunit beta n=1 Tax=Sulfitobacter sp. SK012 TaxID=1389005 RepID=UPI000E0C3DE8|nr:nitrile hydratase subunit beta [Sulfitobacter sp. SK012]AXI47407.1 nitrile hydratase subunit beta [Sulfitobacter sp. SK012]
MSRVHDMGGRFGDGPVIPEAEGEVFHEDWHKRALALTLASGSLGKWNIDISRHARECLAPTDYAAFSYYEKWMAGLADLLVARDVLTREELSGGAVGATDLAEKMLTSAKVPAVLAAGGPSDRPTTTPAQFAPGDAVITRAIAENTLVDGGHTRLPMYGAGARGRILRVHGNHVLPDSSAHGLGDGAEPLYAVVFEASELWAHPEHPRDEVVLDLWQSYLLPQ